jgi:uncharacterized protein (TIGR03083 family)
VDQDAITAAVEAERRGLADQLEELGPDEWRVRSLCPEWTVHDVLAHLTLATRLSKAAAIGGVLRARGDVNSMIRDSSRRRAREFGPAELVAQLRETAGSARRPLGTQPPDPLVDVLVHGQDMTRPLGRRRDMPPDRVGPALDHVWTSSFYGARKRFAGLRLVATDLDWSAGDGDREVRGPAGDLLLLATGRAAGLDGLGGPGRDEAAARLGA